MPHLFEPLTLRDLTLRNRVVVSPMCQYSSVEGFPNDWHLVHLGSHAVGGAGLVFTEAAAVVPEGRISPDDLGIWSDLHIGALARIVRFVRGEGSAVGMQIAHAGRKGSTYAPWRGHGAVPLDEGGWEPLGPTTAPFADGYPVPRAMTAVDIAEAIEAFRQAAERVREAGFDVLEIHAAHGYLVHEFLSPLSNTRTDECADRSRTGAVSVLTSSTQSAVWPEERPLFMRISATDWVEGAGTLTRRSNWPGGHPSAVSI